MSHHECATDRNDSAIKKRRCLDLLVLDHRRLMGDPRQVLAPLIVVSANCKDIN